MSNLESESKKETMKKVISFIRKEQNKNRENGVEFFSLKSTENLLPPPEPGSWKENIFLEDLMNDYSNEDHQLDKNLLQLVPKLKYPGKEFMDQHEQEMGKFFSTNPLFNHYESPNPKPPPRKIKTPRIPMGGPANRVTKEPEKIIPPPPTSSLPEDRPTQPSSNSIPSHNPHQKLSQKKKKKKKKTNKRSFKAPRKRPRTPPSEEFVKMNQVPVPPSLYDTPSPDSYSPPKPDFVSGRNYEDVHKPTPPKRPDPRKRRYRSNYSGGRGYGSNQPFNPVNSLRQNVFNRNPYRRNIQRDEDHEDEEEEEDTEPKITGKKRTRKKFVPPTKKNTGGSEPPKKRAKFNKSKKTSKSKKSKKEEEEEEIELPPKLAQLLGTKTLPEELESLNLELMGRIANEIVSSDLKTTFDDICGLEEAKRAVKEAVIFPLKAMKARRNNTNFQGLRSPGNVLLFGPPGTGKTLIGKAIAGATDAQFFLISASSLMSKWVGEGERMVRTMFGIARYVAPSIIFIDEIDSMLSKRGSGDTNTGTSRMKTEFFINLDGAQKDVLDPNKPVVLIGATNLPQELDDAFLRRMSKRLYVPLPNSEARKKILIYGLEKGQCKYNVQGDELDEVVEKTKGFSGSDLQSVLKDAAYGPVRDMIDQKGEEFLDQSPDLELRAIVAEDILNALKSTRKTVNEKSLKIYEEWRAKHGVE